MALIIDPDLLNDSAADDASTEVFINTTTKRIKLVVTGNLSTDGVTLKALYSFLKEEWRNDPNGKNLAAFTFPMVPITDEAFEFVGDLTGGWNWDFFNDTGRNLIRTAGWTVRNSAGNVTAMYAGIIGLGSIESNDQIYYQQAAGGSSTNFVLLGQVNQAVQILSDPNGDGAYGDGFDLRTFLKLFTREQGQLYDTATNTEIGVASLAAQAYRFPIGTGADLKVTIADVGIDADANNVADVAPFSGMSITYYAAPQVRSIGGTNRNFGVIINGNSGTAEQIYQFVQWSLRRTTDIDAGGGTLVGKIADDLLLFVGDTLKTLSVTNAAGGGSGVYIDSFATADTNRLVFTDNTATERTFPFVAVLQINFGDNLKLDASAKYWAYFTTLPGASNDFGESGAVLVDDNAGADITGTVGGASSVTVTFNYDGNVQGGRTAGTDAPITVIGIGLLTGQYVKATTTLGRSITNSVSLVAALERNYANP
jgi:hypothetical protein